MSHTLVLTTKLSYQKYKNEQTYPYKNKSSKLLNSIQIRIQFNTNSI